VQFRGGGADNYILMSRALRLLGDLERRVESRLPFPSSFPVARLPRQGLTTLADRGKRAMSHRFVCFVIMPFGCKPDPAGRLIDFDRIYAEIIAPAVEAAGLLGVRADEEKGAGFIHKLMYERILLSDFAIADLTILNANVYYELGIRHAARPSTTVLTMALGSPLPFDVGPLRALPYGIGADGAPNSAPVAREAMTRRLIDCRRQRGTDSPLFQLLDGYAAPPIDHAKTDVFREQVAYSQALKNQLADARAQGVEALDKVRDELGDIDTTEAGVAVDLMLSYRAVSQWSRIVDLHGRMDPALARTVLVREQCAMALNRVGRDREAETMLDELIAERGPSSETCGILGRVHKDRWEKALKAGQTLAARGHLRKAIAAYRQGFETDWRDAYPGINAITLMTIENPKNPETKELAAVVRYAVRRRLVGKPDYWDQATLVEIAAIENDMDAAEAALVDALAALDEPWKAKTTADNLRRIADAREAAGVDARELRP
jgi:tetratricopeptide (TPR) repeat protein